MASARVRGSTWNNKRKKKGFKKSVGSYYQNKPGRKEFRLTAVNGGKIRVYDSPQEEKANGWVRV
jgi:hypothetical protein